MLMAKEVAQSDELLEVSNEPTEPNKKGPMLMLLIVGIVAIIQCIVLVVIFKDEITSFFEGLKPEPVEVVLQYPLEEISVNLAEPRHFLKTTLSVEYKDETLTPLLEEKKADVQATIVEVLRSKTYDEVDSVEDTHQLASDIIQALNQLFETKAFSNIYFTDYLYQ